MNPRNPSHARRGPQAVAITVSLVAHLVVAAAAYAYASWPATPTVMVIPVEVVAAPAPSAPGSGSAGNDGQAGPATIGDDAVDEQIAADVKPLDSEAEEVAFNDQPSPPPDQASIQTASETAADASDNAAEIVAPPVTTAAADPIVEIVEITPLARNLTADVPTDDVDDDPIAPDSFESPAPAAPEVAPAREQNQATTRAQAAIAEASVDEPAPVIVKVTEPPTASALEVAATTLSAVATPNSQWRIELPPLRPELNPAARQAAAIPNTAWDGPPPKPQQVNPIARPTVTPLVAASITPPQTIVPATPRVSPQPKPGVATAKPPPLPQARPSSPTRASSTIAPVQTVSLEPPIVRLPRPRPTRQLALKTLATPSAKAAVVAPAGQISVRAATTSEPTEPTPIAAPQPDKSSPSTSGVEASLAPSANPGGGGGVGAGAASGTALRPLPGNPAPRYPRLARERGWQGRVIIEVAVIADGTVNRAEIDQSSGYRLLDQAALRAVRRWRFAVDAPRLPAQGAVVRVPITFKLSD